MESPRIIGRYALHEKIASGGMGSVHLGRLLGAVGFARTVAIKRMHEQLTEDPRNVSMFLDEARLAARIHHPNVVSTLDVVQTDSEVFLVMEYVEGVTLSRLLLTALDLDDPLPIPVAATILSGVLRGLHAAHEAKDEQGQPLEIVHRDVSPQNILVGIDGVPRLLDFGVAKAASRLQTTREGHIKGKIAYMPPEQLRGAKVTRRSDIYAAAVVLWETLTSRRLFPDENEAAILHSILTQRIDPPSKVRPEVMHELDAVVLRGLSRDPEQRYATASEMASAIEAAVSIAIAPVVGEWVQRGAGETLRQQAARRTAVESSEMRAMEAPEPAVESSFNMPVAAPLGSSEIAALGLRGAKRLDPVPSENVKSVGGIAIADVARPKRNGALIGGVSVVGVAGVVAIALAFRARGKPAVVAPPDPITTTSAAATTSAPPATSASVSPPAPSASPSTEASTTARPSPAHTHAPQVRPTRPKIPPAASTPKSGIKFRDPD